MLRRALLRRKRRKIISRVQKFRRVRPGNAKDGKESEVVVKKRVLVSLLEENEGLARVLCQELARAGLDAQAHFWDASPENMAWSLAARELASCSAWVIAGTDFGNGNVRRTLSLAALCAQAESGNGFPILISPSGKELDASSLPDPLRGADVVKSGLGVKTAVQAGTFKKLTPEYRLRPHAPAGLGLWFEVGPASAPWGGAFVAGGSADTDKAVPDVHGVGRAGAIPARCTLRYPVEGIRLDVRQVPCVGWGVKNELTPSDSYYVRFGAIPDVVAFGPFPDADDAELYTVSLI